MSRCFLAPLLVTCIIAMGIAPASGTSPMFVPCIQHKLNPIPPDEKDVAFAALVRELEIDHWQCQIKGRGRDANVWCNRTSQTKNEAEKKESWKSTAVCKLYSSHSYRAHYSTWVEGSDEKKMGVFDFHVQPPIDDRFDALLSDKE